MANLSQMKRERMLAFLDMIREKHKDNDEVLIALGEIENELTSKKYGLVWEKHEETVDVQMRDNIQVFTEATDREICEDADGRYNFLLEGDNLHCLRLLEKTHRGKIDVIYIDPPYNTKNKDFIYDDVKIDSTDGYQHSKWLSFMSERLRIARNLLSKNGVLAISIGYQEVNNLMLLCQELFYSWQIVCVTVQTSSGNAVANGFTYVQEYIVFVTPLDFLPYEVEGAKKDYITPYHRKFILCTNNENGICEDITFPRIKTVITGKRMDESVYSDGIPANLKYYCTDFVSKDSDDVSAELLKHITEMVQLEHGIKIDNKEYLIVLSDDEADDLEQHWSEYPNMKALYISKDVLLTTSQNTLFGSVPMYIIPDYYFKFELREIGEAW